MLAAPKVEGVKLTEQVAVPAVPATRAQVLESKDPGTTLEAMKVTVPNGLVTPVVLLSVTVAVHTEA